MIRRQALALAAGVGLGIIIQESLWVGVDALDPGHSLNRALVQAPLSDGWLAPLVAAWLAGGAFGGLMATLIGRNRVIGHVAGLLLSGSALLVAACALPDAGRFLVIAGSPSVGAGLGAWLGITLLEGEDDRRTSPGVASVPRRKSCTFQRPGERSGASQGSPGMLDCLSKSAGAAHGRSPGRPKEARLKRQLCVPILAKGVTIHRGSRLDLSIQSRSEWHRIYGGVHLTSRPHPLTRFPCPGSTPAATSAMRASLATGTK